MRKGGTGDRWGGPLTVFENKLFSVVEGQCEVDLQFQVSLVGGLVPLT